MTTNPDDPTGALAGLNVSLPSEFHKIIKKYANALPVTAAHGVPITEGGKANRIYWVSGASLVTLDYALEKVDGADAAIAKGHVRRLASARLDIGAITKSSGQLQAVQRNVQLHFPDEQPVQFPDPLSPPLNDAGAFEKHDTFIDALLRALDH